MVGIERWDIFYLRGLRIHRIREAKNKNMQQKKEKKFFK
jgi:hypothetical protein